MRKIISSLLVLAIIFGFTACTPINKSMEKYSASFLDLFDTASTVIAYDNSQEEFDRKYQLFHDELQEYDNLYDIYNSYDGINNLYTVNKYAGEKPVEVDDKIIDLLLYGKEIYTKTNGRVNICFGAVLSLWHAQRTIAKDDPALARLPYMDELELANEHCNIDDLIIDEDNSTVYFNDPLLKLDVGAIAKGFAVQRITDYSRENLWDNAAISIGGNISTFGYKNNDGKTLWNIGLENPDRTADDYLLNVKVTDACIVTSGDYQRYYTVDGKNYCHIINPDTLMPSEYASSVSVICNDSALGDALSTALFNMPIDEGKTLVDSMDGVEVVWVDKTYKNTFSNGFKQYMSDGGTLYE